MSIDTDAQTSDPPLGHDQAVEIDDQIRAMADKAGTQLDGLAQLLAKAQTGQIHHVLQFDSWTAYLADRLKPIAKALDADDRRALVAELYEAGMSTRAIAEAVGRSKSSIHRQVSQSGTGGLGGNVTGLDDKQYQRRNGGGGHRGPLDVVMKLRRAGSVIKNINGFEPDDAEKQSEICRLIDDWIASLKPGNLIKLEQNGIER